MNVLDVISLIQIMPRVEGGHWGFSSVDGGVSQIALFSLVI